VHGSPSSTHALQLGDSPEHRRLRRWQYSHALPCSFRMFVAIHRAWGFGFVWSSRCGIVAYPHPKACSVRSMGEGGQGGMRTNGSKGTMSVRMNNHLPLRPPQPPPPRPSAAIGRRWSSRARSNGKEKAESKTYSADPRLPGRLPGRGGRCSRRTCLGVGSGGQSG
jgi:hypothetical protein